MLKLVTLTKPGEPHLLATDGSLFSIGTILVNLQVQPKTIGVKI